MFVNIIPEIKPQNYHKKTNYPTFRPLLSFFEVNFLLHILSRYDYFCIFAMFLYRSPPLGGREGAGTDILLRRYT